MGISAIRELKNRMSYLKDVIVPLLGLSIVILPSFGYLLILVFNLPYFAYFKIPISLMTIDTQDLVLLLIFTVVFLILTMGFLLTPPPDAISPENNPEPNAFPNSFILTVGLAEAFFFLFALVAPMFNWKNFTQLIKDEGFSRNYIVLVFILLLFLLVFILILANQGLKFKRLYYLVLEVLFSLILAYTLGFSLLPRPGYYVINESPECVVLYMKADRAICAPFDRANNVIETKFRIIYYADNPNIQLSFELIGPFHRNPDPTSKTTPAPGLKP